MSYSSEDWKKAISNLIKKSSRKEVTWQVSDLFQGDSWNDVVKSFQCVINDKIYVVSETRYRHYLDENEWVWNGGYDFSVFKKQFEPKQLASAPSTLHAIGSLFSIAESAYAFSSNALGDLLD